MADYTSTFLKSLKPSSQPVNIKQALSGGGLTIDVPQSNHPVAQLFTGPLPQERPQYVAGGGQGGGVFKSIPVQRPTVQQTQPQIPYDAAPGYKPTAEYNPSATDLINKSFQGKSLPDKILAPIAKTVVGFGSGLFDYVKDITDTFAENKISQNQATAAPRIVGKTVLPSQREGSTGILDKSTAQLIGDSAQAALTFYTPSLAKNLLESGFTNQATGQVIKQLAIHGAKEGLTAGVPFGVAQALSSGTKDPNEFAKIVLTTSAISAALGAATGAGPAVVKKGFESIGETKQKLVDHLVSTGYSPTEAVKMAQEGGYFKLFESPKALELGAKLNDYNKLKTEGKSATIRKNAEKMYQQTLKEYKRESQGGFISLGKETPITKQIDQARELINQAKKGTGGETDRIFKGTQFNLDDVQTAHLDSLQTALGLGKRNVRTFEDMTLLAQDLGTDVPSLLRSSASKQITDAEVKGLGDLIHTNTKFIKQASQDLSSVATSAEKDLLTSKIAAAENQIETSLKKLRIGNTENGRAIVANRILANQIDNPTFWYAKAEGMLSNGGKGFTPEIRTAIDDLIKKHDVNGLSLFISSLRTASTAEKAITLWKAGLLTSPTTHAANILGNTAFAGAENVSDVVATGLDKLISFATGKRTKSFSPGQVGAEIKGAVSGLKQAPGIIKNGKDITETLSKFDIPKQVNFDNKLLDRYTKGVFGTLSAEDKIFRESALKGSLYEQARVAALNEKLKGDAFKSRVKELFLNPTEEMTLAAIDASEFRTFNNTTKLAKAIGTGKQQLGAGGKLVAEYVAPFTKTPLNIAGRMVDYSPAGLVTTLLKQVNPETRGQKELVEGLARGITGTTVIATGALLAKEGLMTGNKLTDQEKAEGKVPNAVKIGDKWVQVTRLSPIGNLLALGAEYDRLSQDQKGTSLATSTGFAGIQQLSQQTFLKGVSGILNAINDPKRYGESYAESAASSLVPTVVGRAANVIDPRQKNPEGILQALESKIPFLSKSVAPSRDLFGNVIKTGGGSANIIDPFNTQTIKDEPAIKEARKVGAELNTPNQTVSGIKLTNGEYDVYSKVQGKLLKPYLEALIKTPEYQALNDDQKAKELKNTQSEVRTEINKLLFPGLMIKRYKLDPKTDPVALTKIIESLSKNQEFKTAEIEQQKRMIETLYGNLETDSGGLPVP